MGRQEKPLAVLVKILRAAYPKGSRVELVQMDDIQAPPLGTQGTVQGVDDIGTIMVHWDNGSHLGIVLGADICRKINDLSAPREILRFTAVETSSTLDLVAASRPTVTVWPLTVVVTPFVPETVSF